MVKLLSIAASVIAVQIMCMSPCEDTSCEGGKEIRLNSSRDQIENIWITVYMLIDTEQKEENHAYFQA